MDDPDSIIMILVMIALTALSAFFSATETAFSSFNRLRIKSMAQNGSKKAEEVMKLDDRYDRFITTILIGNNIVNITLTAVATVFFVNLFLSFGSNMGATVSTIVVTIVVLVFGEISPKAIARDHADSYVLSTVGFVNFLVAVFLPLSAAFGYWKKLLNKIFKVAEDVGVTEDELITMVDEAEQDGEIDENEGELIRSAIEFSDVTAGEILTPRVDVVSIDAESTDDEIMEAFADSGFSRLPVCGESIDDVIGILHEKDFFYSMTRKKTKITKLMKKPVFVSRHLKINELLQNLKKSQCHMAIVLDEFGGTLGVVTMEDIIEELIGDVWDEHDEIEEEFEPQPDGSCVVDGSAELDDLFDMYDLEPENDDVELPQTINGWLQMLTGDFPEVGETIEYGNIKIEVTKTDEKKVIEVIVTKKTDDGDDAPDDE